MTTPKKPTKPRASQAKGDKEDNTLRDASNLPFKPRCIDKLEIEDHENFVNEYLGQAPFIKQFQEFKNSELGVRDNADIFMDKKRFGGGPKLQATVVKVLGSAAHLLSTTSNRIVKAGTAQNDQTKQDHRLKIFAINMLEDHRKRVADHYTKTETENRLRVIIALFVEAAWELTKGKESFFYSLIGPIEQTVGEADAGEEYQLGDQGSSAIETSILANGSDAVEKKKGAGKAGSGTNKTALSKVKPGASAKKSAKRAPPSDDSADDEAPAQAPNKRAKKGDTLQTTQGLSLDSKLATSASMANNTLPGPGPAKPSSKVKGTTTNTKQRQADAVSGQAGSASIDPNVKAGSGKTIGAQAVDEQTNKAQRPAREVTVAGPSENKHLEKDVTELKRQLPDANAVADTPTIQQPVKTASQPALIDDKLATVTREENNLQAKLSQMETELVTMKAEMQSKEAEMKAGMEAKEAEMKAGMEAKEAEMKSKMQAKEAEIKAATKLSARQAMGKGLIAMWKNMEGAIGNGDDEETAAAKKGIERAQKAMLSQLKPMKKFVYRAVDDGDGDEGA